MKVSLAATCSSINQNGITWTFDQAYECGQFVNGDWWVVAPVTITNKTPAWTGIDHGSMLDPPSGSDTQGFRDNTNYLPYSNSLRVSFPTTISSGVKSLVSVETDPTNGGGTPANHSFVLNAAVLTIVNSAPSATSFRPPFVAGAKPLYDSATVNYSLVPSYSAPPTALNLTGYANMPWLSIGASTFGEDEMMPRNDVGGNGYPPYGSSKVISQLSMLLLLNTANRISYINKLIQIGIDDYGKAVGSDIGWLAAGGFGQSHLWPIVFAGKMLNSATILSVPRFMTRNPLLRKFGEQGYTYYNAYGVAMFGSDTCMVGESVYPPTSCSNNMCRPQDNTVGRPEGFPENYWGECGGGYRDLVSPAYIGQSLAMRMLEPTLGTMTAFNHPSYFDYTDYWATNVSRANTYVADGNYGGTGNGFMTYMWDTYRSAITALDTTPPVAPTGLSVV